MLVKVREDIRDGFVGFYGDKRRYPGEKFEIFPIMKDGVAVSSEEEQFSEAWMEKIESAKKSQKHKL